MGELAFESIDDLRREMESMDEAEQRRFVRRLSMETHVQLQLHLKAELSMQQQFAAFHGAMFRVDSEGKLISKLDEVHAALFDPMNGLVNMKKWLCRIAWACGALLVGAIPVISGVIKIMHDLGFID